MKILVVGQTPPPWGGQAVMIQRLLDAKNMSVHFYHVPMGFSDNMNVVGKFKLKKMLHLVSVIVSIIVARCKYGTKILYYPPGGPKRVPFYRDSAILILTRWMFRGTVFHFHASGISTFYPSLNSIEKILFNLAYKAPVSGIRTSWLNPDDPLFVNAKQSVVIENGIPDEFPRFKNIKYNNSHYSKLSYSKLRLLFVGALYETKGIRILIEAANLLKLQGHEFQLVCVGCFESEAYEHKIKTLIDVYELARHVTFPGVLSGDAKWEAYARADVFCFPSFFESESFGLVNLEAMQFEVPVVSTQWRGIPSVVEDGKTGFLVPIKDSKAVAEKIAILLDNPELRKKMGERAREVYLEKFTVERFCRDMENAFLSLDV